MLVSLTKLPPAQSGPAWHHSRFPARRSVLPNCSPVETPVNCSQGQSYDPQRMCTLHKTGNQNHAFLVRLHCQSGRRWEAIWLQGQMKQKKRKKKHTHNEASVVSWGTLQLMRLVDAKKSWCERCGLLVRATASKHWGFSSFIAHSSTTQQRRHHHHHHLWWCQQPQQQPLFRAARRQEVVSESWTEAEALWCMHASRTHW